MLLSKNSNRKPNKLGLVKEKNSIIDLCKDG